MLQNAAFHLGLQCLKKYLNEKVQMVTIIFQKNYPRQKFLPATCVFIDFQKSFKDYINFIYIPE